MTAESSQQREALAERVSQQARVQDEFRELQLEVAFSSVEVAAVRPLRKELEQAETHCATEVSIVKYLNDELGIPEEYNEETPRTRIERAVEVPFEMQQQAAAAAKQ